MQNPESHSVANLKIWIFTDHNPITIYGGGEEANAQFILHAAPQVRGINLFYKNDSPLKRAVNLPDNVVVENLPVTGSVKLLELSRQLRKRADKEGPDIVLATQPGKLASLSALSFTGFGLNSVDWWMFHPVFRRHLVDPQIFKSAKKAVVFDYLRAAIREPFSKFLYHQSNISHAACSGFIADELRKVGYVKGTIPILNPPTSVGLNGKNGEHLEVPGLEANDQVMMVPVRIVPDKQIHRARQLVNGLSRMPPSSFLALGYKRLHLVFAGSPDQEYLKKALPRSNSDHVVVTYAGVLTKPQMQALYERSQCVFNPNADESYGLVTVEGMRYGKPILGIASGGTKEILDEFPGYPSHLMPKRVQLLDEDIKESACFLRHSPDLNQVGIAHYQRIIERFDPAKLSEQMLRLLASKAR